MQRVKNAAGRAATTATTNRRSVYPSRNEKSTRHRRISPRSANRQKQTPRDRTALTLLCLAGSLQRSIHITPDDRRYGWVLFAELLRYFVGLCHV